MPSQEFGLDQPSAERAFRELRGIAKCVHGLNAARDLIAKARMIRRLRIARLCEERSENMACGESGSHVADEYGMAIMVISPCFSADSAELMEVAA